MLKTRVVTAVLLLAVLLPSLFFLPQFIWCLVTAAIVGVAGWEWGGFMQLTMRLRVLVGVAQTIICFFFLGFFPTALGAGLAEFSPQTLWPLFSVAAVFWLFLAPLWLHNKYDLRGKPIGVVVGAVAIVPAWVALAQLRMLGVWELLAVLVLVWVADIFAYFCGRAFGRHKLAVTISPGKTWEGAIGGAVAVLAYGLTMRYLFKLDAAPVWLWTLGLIAVTAVSIVGDLFESLLKRQAGLKDSSQVLPGHGGVLDRIDSLTSTLPLVALMWLMFSYSKS